MKTLPSLYIVSDLHLDTGPFEWPAAALNADIIVVAGDLSNGAFDIEFLNKPGKPVIFVPGNHDFWSRPDSPQDLFDMLKNMRDKAKGTSVHILWDNEVVVQGVRFLGTPLWSNFGAFNEELLNAASTHVQDYRYINARSWYAIPGNLELHRAQGGRFDPFSGPSAEESGAFTPLIAYELHKKSIAWLEHILEMPHEGPTVLVTHMAPSYKCLKESGAVREHWLDKNNWRRQGLDNSELAKVAAYASDLDWLFEQHADAIDLAIHGHLHYSIETIIHSTRTLANPRGRYLGPLSKSSSKDFAWFGVSVTEKHIQESQTRFKEYPYWGDNWQFEANKLVRLEDGLAPALQPHIDAVLPELEELLTEMRELLPFVSHRNPIIRRSVQEAAHARGKRFNELISAKLKIAAQAFGISAYGVDKGLAFLDEMHLQGMSHQVIPYFDTPFKERVDPQARLGDALAGMEMAITLLPKVPYAAALAQNIAKDKVSAVRELLSAKGISSVFEGSAENPFWRKIYFDIGTFKLADELSDEVCSLLDREIDQIVSGGRIPRRFCIGVSH